MENNAPIAKFNAGTVQVAVWENESKKEGRRFKTVSLDRRIKVGEEWRSTKSFGMNDLPKAIVALQKAYESLALKEQA